MSTCDVIRKIDLWVVVTALGLYLVLKLWVQPPPQICPAVLYKGVGFLGGSKQTITTYPVILAFLQRTWRRKKMRKWSFRQAPPTTLLPPRPSLSPYHVSPVSLDMYISLCMCMYVQACMYACTCMHACTFTGPMPFVTISSFSPEPLDGILRSRYLATIQVALPSNPIQTKLGWPALVTMVPSFE